MRKGPELALLCFKGTNVKKVGITAAQAEPSVTHIHTKY